MQLYRSAIVAQIAEKGFYGGTVAEQRLHHSLMCMVLCSHRLVSVHRLTPDTKMSTVATWDK